jgi:2',3'-cyclic-nucleotide 2'-phosphodiesterase/3'-nucleotidase
VVSAAETNRDTLIAYIRSQSGGAHGDITRARFGNDHNWHFVRVKTAGPVVFTSAAGKIDLARAAGLNNVALLKDNGDGSALYSIDLSR